NTARYWGVLQRTAENGRSVRRARIWLAYSVLPSVARRRSNTSPCTRLKSGKARSNWRTTSSSPREAIRTTAMPPGSDSVANAGGSSGQRSLSDRLRVTLRPRGSPPGTRMSRWRVVPLSPWSIHAAARCQRSAGVGLLGGGGAFGGGRDRRSGRTGGEPRRGVFHPLILLPPLLATAGVNLPLPARAPSRPPAAPQAHRVRVALTAVFIVFNLP